MARTFEPWEYAVLAVCQGNLPDTLTPYADIGKACGASEEQVLELLEKLKTDGAIRRFGATIRHQHAGWGHNAMVAWLATEEEADHWGPIAAKNPNVSHVYFRPSQAADWPYTLYTMAHGRTAAECDRVIGELAASWPQGRYSVLKTVRELKKISMTYFAS